MANRPALTFQIDREAQRAIGRAIDGVKAGVANRVVKQAIAKVARAAAKTAKALAPVGKWGALKRAIGTSYRGQPKAGRWTYKVGARRGYSGFVMGRRVDATRYVHLAEFGRKAVRPSSSKAMPIGVAKEGGRDAKGRFLKQVIVTTFARYARAARGRPFLTPAWRSVEAGGLSRLAADVRAGIIREAQKYAARGKSILR